MLNCYFPDAMTPEEIEAAVKALNAHLFNNWGRPATHALVLAWATDRHYDVRYAGRTEVDVTMAMNRRRFILPLVAFDPLAYGEQQQQEDEITASPQTIEYDIDSGINVEPTIILDNAGAAAIEGFTFKTYDEIFDWTPV